MPILVFPPGSRQAQSGSRDLLRRGIGYSFGIPCGGYKRESGMSVDSRTSRLRGSFEWSGRLDLNQRPLHPECDTDGLVSTSTSLGYQRSSP